MPPSGARSPDDDAMTSVATRNGLETAASTAHERSVVGLTLAEALRYATRWRGKTVVVKLGGSVLDRAESATLEDVVLLQRAGVRIVLVHGGGPEITRMLDRLGHPRALRGRPSGDR